MFLAGKSTVSGREVEDGGEVGDALVVGVSLARYVKVVVCRHPCPQHLYIYIQVYI